MTPFERRTSTVQDRLGDNEAVILSPSPNLYYLTGVWEAQTERHFFVIIGPDAPPVMVVPELSIGQVQEDTWVTEVRGWADEDDPLTVLESAVTDRGLSEATFLVEPTMWTTFSEDIRATFPQATIELADDLLASIRLRKDTAELETLRRVAELTDRVSVSIRQLGEDAIGLTETELAHRIEDELLERGGTGVSFETIVGSGPNGAHPHHTHDDRTIQPGDPVVLDFGTRLDHYPSDQTRTVVFAGSPSQAFQDAHDAVLDAQHAAIEEITPGVTPESIDDAARTVLTDRGYGDEFIHRTGHGVGLDVHEPPYIVEGNDRVLEPGMVFSVEPGVYREGEFGVRIEDLVVVTDDGCERLNDSPRDWTPPT